MVRSVTPMISAAAHQVIFLAIAFKQHVLHSHHPLHLSGRVLPGLFHHPASQAAASSGQLTCELHRTSHILATRLLKTLDKPARAPLPCRGNFETSSSRFLRCASDFSFERGHSVALDIDCGCPLASHV